MAALVFHACHAHQSLASFSLAADLCHAEAAEHEHRVLVSGGGGSGGSGAGGGAGTHVVIEHNPHAAAVIVSKVPLPAPEQGQ